MGFLFNRKRQDKYSEEENETQNYDWFQEEKQQDVVSEEEQETGTGKQDKLDFVEDCCEQILECAKRQTDARKEYTAVNGYLEDIRKIEEQDRDRREKLAYTARRILNLKEDKVHYQTYETKVPETMYFYIQNHEEEMPQILKDLHDDEEDLQTIKSNLDQLEGEKSALKYEGRENARHLKNLRKIAGTITALTVIALGVIFYFHLTSDYDFTIGIFLTVAIAAFLMVFVISRYKKETAELRLNEKKMNKAIGLLNKNRLLYVNLKNRVDYVYEKLELHSSYELNNYWRLYLNAKKEREVYGKMTDELYKEQKSYKEQIDGLQLYDSSVWDYQMDAVADEKSMQEIVENLERRKKSLRKTIDFQKKRSEKYKQKIKRLTEREPALAGEILKIVEEKGEMLG